ncbi:hypothetical protein DFH09DRAFT_202912 [Mycena vulgaris]|nr:hypothetical protein DFH09DRAFT_202912 [Mycena vulgaris]
MLSAASPRSLAFLIIGATITLLVLYPLARVSFASRGFSLSSSPDPVGVGDRRTSILPLPSRTYVISLPHRKDRYEDMERLRTRLGLEWSYVPAEDSQSSLVGRIMSQIRTMRQEELKLNEYPPNTTISLPFEWPSTPVSIVPFEDPNPPPPPPDLPTASDSQPLTCATENFTLLPYSPGLQEYKILSRSRIACWYSHLSVIQRTAAHLPEKTSLILEDDVDMEVDIKDRLLSVWSLLPPDWDILFLGHCWSNESYHPALGPPSGFSPQLKPALQTRLHPSRAPLCTHAYALSPTGAQKLLLHLTYPRFAYSRAIDHALAWLVQSGRLKSFSVVPSVVVQRKVGSSDVMVGTGSKWREHLAHSVLAEGAGIL